MFHPAQGLDPIAMLGGRHQQVFEEVSDAWTVKDNLTIRRLDCAGDDGLSRSSRRWSYTPVASPPQAANKGSRSRIVGNDSPRTIFQLNSVCCRLSDRMASGLWIPRSAVAMAFLVP